MSFSISKWVAPPPETFDPPQYDGAKVEWFRCVPYIVVHLLAVLAFFQPFVWPCLLICLLSYSARMFSITAFYHRYFSHRAFKTNRLVQFFGGFVACVVQDNEVPYGGPHIIAFITDTLIPIRTHIPQRPTAYCGVTRFGL